MTQLWTPSLATPSMTHLVRLNGDVWMCYNYGFVVLLVVE